MPFVKGNYGGSYPNLKASPPKLAKGGRVAGQRGPKGHAYIMDRPQSTRNNVGYLSPNKKGGR